MITAIKPFEAYSSNRCECFSEIFQFHGQAQNPSISQKGSFRAVSIATSRANKGWHKLSGVGRSGAETSGTIETNRYLVAIFTFYHINFLQSIVLSYKLQLCRWHMQNKFSHVISPCFALCFSMFFGTYGVCVNFHDQHH